MPFPPHNDLDNLDSLTSQQINEIYDDVYIDSFKNPAIAVKNNECPLGKACVKQ